MSIHSFEEALPGLRALRSTSPRQVDWGAISRELGVSLPSDYRQLSESYPRFSISDFLFVSIPQPGEERGFVAGIREQLDDLGSLVDSEMNHGYLPYPKAGGLIPWGSSFEGDTFYWHTDQTCGDWSVVIAGHNDDWVAYSGTMTEYLTGLVSGVISPDGLPDGFPGPTPNVEAL
ncbi:SMI1/KNR4 family protein [Streptomyces hundungensis]|uniref:SMI1/KNR4 family protein n=1 Tax=Streptomyces hundungensis TaxID=1077946 RepID=UPI0013C50932|nr:SMI1/KNR4 family protein [Streptomyces hundungensis]